MPNPTNNPPSPKAKNDRKSGFRYHFITIPRWPGLFVIPLIGLLYAILSEQLTFGPSWLLPSVLLALLVISIVMVLLERHHIVRALTLAATALATFMLINSVALLLIALATHTISPLVLFRDAVLLWLTNIFVFAYWYWQLDQGGIIKRHTNRPERAELLFPQMVQTLSGWEDWRPIFFDYLFVAFNNSTAFSPTDTLILSWRFKLLTMVQSSISLLIVVVLAARAVNIV